MAGSVTLEQVEALAAQLPAPERLKLAARICEQVGSGLPEAAELARDVEERKRQEALCVAEQLLAECEDVEDDSKGTSDAVEVLRQLRDERIAAICQRGA